MGRAMKINEGLFKRWSEVREIKLTRPITVRLRIVCALADG